MSLLALKLIALLSMTLDHFAKYLIYPLVQPAPDSVFAIVYKYALLPAGRLAFPIFAFTIANGCRLTGNPRRYLARLWLFALVSQPFFSLLRGARANVMVTLALAATAILVYTRSGKKPCVALLAFAGAAAAAFLLRSDYGIWGVSAVFAAYLAYGCFSGAAIWAVMAAWLTFSLYGGEDALYFAAMLAAITVSALLVGIYNGKKGGDVKWLFYCWYPAHLAVLCVLRALLLS